MPLRVPEPINFMEAFTSFSATTSWTQRTFLRTPAVSGKRRSGKTNSAFPRAVLSERINCLCLATMRGSATRRVFPPRFLYHQTPRGWESLAAEPRGTSQLEHPARTAILPLPDTICPLWHPSASMTMPRNICLSGPVPHLLRPDQILDHSLSPLDGSSA